MKKGDSLDHIPCDEIDTIISCIPFDKSQYKHNENFFNKEFFSRFKSGIDFISISRGATHNNKDFVELLSNNFFGDVYVDTFDSEVRDKLLEFDNLHYSEHTAWNYRPLSKEKSLELLKFHLGEAKKLL